MQLVIADTGPVNYLILIGHIDLLPRLFSGLILPTAVKEELRDIGAPLAVRAWIGSPPDWLETVETPGPGPVPPGLDEGEAAVIALAISLRAIWFDRRTQGR